jgi:hypothetical protein
MLLKLMIMLSSMRTLLQQYHCCLRLGVHDDDGSSRCKDVTGTATVCTVQVTWHVIALGGNYRGRSILKPS